MSHCCASPRSDKEGGPGAAYARGSGRAGTGATFAGFLRRWRWPLLIALPVLVVAVWFTFGQGRSTGVPQSASLGPRLQFDETSVDFGQVPLNRTGAQQGASLGPRLQFDETGVDFGQVPLNQVVEHDFVYRNVGEGVLELGGQPTTEAVQGC